MKYIVDVRSKEEYDSGHVEGALNIPLEELASGDTSSLDNVPKDSEIVCYCISGARAERFVHALRALGYEKVENGGGIM